MDEILQGNVTKKYLDNKEQKAIIYRHINRLTDDRDFLEDTLKMDLCTFRKEYFYNKLQKVLCEIVSLQNELEKLEGETYGTK